MKHVIIAPVGEDIENLFISIREFAIEKVALIVSKEKKKLGRDWAEKLKVFDIIAEVYEIESEDFENFLKAVNKIVSYGEREKFIINVSTGDKISACIALSAAFMLGIKAFGVRNKKPMLFPIMRFSYTQIISDRKMEIIKALENEALSIEELSEKLKMSMPLISYHINGNEKTPGLLKLGLVENYNENGKNKFRLSLLGKLIIGGYFTL